MLKIKSLTKEEEFYSLLRNSQVELVLVKFFTTWCLPCRELQKNIEVLLEEKKDMEVIEVDAEKFPRLAQNPEFNVLSVPTIFLFRKGQEKWVGKKSGSLSVNQLKEFIKKAE